MIETRNLNTYTQTPKATSAGNPVLSIDAKKKEKWVILKIMANISEVKVAS
jgi:hypothetical protein